MKMRLFFIAIVAFFLCPSLNAQKSMSDVWVNMPDTLMTYLNWDKRKDLTAYFQMGAEATIPSLLGEEARLLKLTDNYISLKLNQSTNMQMAILKTIDNDSLICMVRTYYGGIEQEGGAAESVIAFYDMQWHKIDNSRFLKTIEPAELTHKPDSIAQETYSQLLRLASPKMVAVEMDENDYSLIYRLTVPMLSAKEQEQIKPIFLQRKLKWDGKMYN